MLPDIQKSQDTRGIEIDQVGVVNVHYPLTLPLRGGGEFNTVADLSMGVSLSHCHKGTHLSRFMIAINEQNHKLTPNGIHQLLSEVLQLLDAENAFINMKFPIFLDRQAPITGISGLIDYCCVFNAMMSTQGDCEKLIGVKANVTTCCPCSKEISAYGAHNQRSEVVIEVRPSEEEFFWFEDLIDFAERNASCQLYPILKRPDEKSVTEHSFDNPKFVEDVVRDIASDLLGLLNLRRIKWFHVASTSRESIHNHDAFASIERGVRGLL